MAQPGRPITWPYDAEIAEQILLLYANGQSLEAICKQDGFPSREIVARWMRDVITFHDSFSRAMAAHGEALASQTLDIADTELDAAKARNRIQVRQWLASKLKPERYGEKLDVNLKGQIDISAAITEAASRVALPMRYQGEAIDAEVTEIPTLPSTATPDHASAGQEKGDDYDPFA